MRRVISLFGDNMIAFQDAYGNAIQAVGLRRGTRGSRAKHREMKNAYRAFKAAKQLAKQEKERLRVQNSEPEAKLKEVTATKNRVISEQQNATQLRAGLLTEVQRAKDLQVELELERNELATLRAKLRKIPIRQVLKKLRFVESEDTVFSAMISNESIANSAIRYRR